MAGGQLLFPIDIQLGHYRSKPWHFDIPLLNMAMLDFASHLPCVCYIPGDQKPLPFTSNLQPPSSMQILDRKS